MQEGLRAITTRPDRQRAHLRLIGVRRFEVAPGIIDLLLVSVGVLVGEAIQVVPVEPGRAKEAGARGRQGRGTRRGHAPPALVA